jgi:hypothetical protein
VKMVAYKCAGTSGCDTRFAIAERYVKVIDFYPSCPICGNKDYQNVDKIRGLISGGIIQTFGGSRRIAN